MADLDTLARELVEAGMPWLPGMLYWIGERDDRYWDRVQDAEAEDWGPPDAAYPDLTDWPTIGALVGELSRRIKPGERLRFGWRRDFDVSEQPFRWIVDLGGTFEDSAGAVRFSSDGPGEAVGRALLAVLRAKREAP